MSKRLSLLLAALAAAPCALAEPPPAAQAEVRHLLGYLERSGCEFFRNGAWGCAAPRTSSAWAPRAAA